MLGAVVGGGLFWLLGIDLGLGEIKITVEDLISAFVGSMLCLGAWWLIRKNRAPKAPKPNLENLTEAGVPPRGRYFARLFRRFCSMRFPQVSQTHRTAALGAPASEDDCHAAHRGPRLLGAFTSIPAILGVRTAPGALA
jgi:hypothetical protein